MSLKQFPSHGKFSEESDRILQLRDPQAFEEIPPRLKAEVFDVDKSWKVMRDKKKAIESHTGMKHFKNMTRTDAARVAAAAGMRITSDFTIEKAVANFAKTKLREFYAYVFFLALFTTVTYLNRDFYQGNMIYNTNRNAIVGVIFDTPERPRVFREIETTEDVWDYLTVGMPKYLFSMCYDKKLQPHECDDKKPEDATKGLLYILRYNQLIQPIRFRQVRVAVQTGLECEANIYIIDDFDECSPVYKAKYLDKTTFRGLEPGSILPYRSGSDLGTADFSRETTMTYDGGGFVIDIPLLSSQEQLQNVFSQLKKARWIDKHTRAIMIDMVTYNPTNMFYLSVRLTFEFLPYGDVRPTYSFRIFKGDIMTSQIDQIILFWLDIVAFALILLHIFWDLWKIFNVGFVIFYKDAYHWMNVIIYVLAISVLVKKFEYLALPAVRALNSAGGATPSTEVYDYESVGWYYNEIEMLTGYIALLCWLKLLDYLRFISKRMAALVETIARCTYDCSVWFFMLFVIVVAYSQAFYLALGPEIDGFDSYSNALGTMMVWIFDVVDYSQVLSADQILASFLFLSFQVVYSMLLVNMFIVILLRSYIDVKKQDYNDPIAAEIRKKVHVVLNRFKEKVFIFLSSLSFRDLSDETDEMNEEEHEMAVERLKEEARQNDFAQQEDDSEEVVVNEGTLMEMVNSLNNVTEDVTAVQKKVNNLVKKINFQQRLQEGVEEEEEGNNPENVLSPLQNDKATRQVQEREDRFSGKTLGGSRANSFKGQTNDEGVAGDSGGGGDTDGGNVSAGGEVHPEAGVAKIGEVAETKPISKGVSFAIAGSAFGKCPTRPSSNSSSFSSQSSQELRGPAEESRRSRRVYFESIQGLHMQWLPSGWEASNSHTYVVDKDLGLEMM